MYSISFRLLWWNIFVKSKTFLASMPFEYLKQLVTIFEDVGVQMHTNLI